MKLVALSFALACVVAFVTSIRYSFGLGIGRTIVGFSGGCIVMDVRPVPVAAQLFVEPAAKLVNYSATFLRNPSGFGGFFLAVPLWAPFVLCLTVAVLAYRRLSDRPRPGACRSCGYDLTGNVTGVCPECGTAQGTQKRLRERTRGRKAKS